MTHYWIVEADSAQDLDKELNEEIKGGAQLAGAAFVSPNRKHYQPIVREISSIKKLETFCLEKFEIR